MFVGFRKLRAWGVFGCFDFGLLIICGFSFWEVSGNSVDLFLFIFI